MEIIRGHCNLLKSSLLAAFSMYVLAFCCIRLTSSQEQLSSFPHHEFCLVHNFALPCVHVHAFARAILLSFNSVFDVKHEVLYSRVYKHPKSYTLDMALRLDSSVVYIENPVKSITRF